MNIVDQFNQSIVRTVGVGNSYQTTIESSDLTEVVFAKPSRTADQAVATHGEILAQVKSGMLGHFTTEITVDDGA